MKKPYEALGVRKNGQEYPLRLEARIIPFKGKQVRSVEFRDITDIKEAEQALIDLNNELESRVNQRTEQLQLANEELKSTLQHLKETQTQLLHSEKMASLGILTAGVAHEINNPLNYISGAYSGLQAYFENKSFSENYEEVGILIDAIKTGVERSTAIVKGLNQFSRNSESLNEDCDIHAIMENSLSMLQNQIKHRIIIEKQYCSDKLQIRGNVGHLHQVFLNIFGNAVQAIPQEGLIKIETESILDKISIKVTDTGMGISAENLEKVTDPFFSTKDAGEGTGLGLAITYNIIREHKGEMEFKSELGKGTTVKIILPKNR